MGAPRSEPTLEPTAREDVPALIARLAGDEGLDRRERARLLGLLSRALLASVRRAGGVALATGRWLADRVVELAPHVPVRDVDTLRRHYGGLTGDELARALVNNASRATAAVGAAGGALASLEYTAPPLLLSAPVEIAAETLAVVAIELKLVAELHEVYGHGVPGNGTQRGAAYVTSWARRRGYEPSGPGIVSALSGAARRELRQRLVRRFGRNVSTLSPFLTGALAGAELNRRETRRLGESLIDDLRR